MIGLNLSVIEALKVLKPLAIFVGGMAIYSVFIFKFYKFLAKREIFEINLDKYKNSRQAAARKFIGVAAYAIKYLLLFPVFTFFWFIFITVLLAFLSKENDISSVLEASIALVSAVRVTAYYNEDLSRDLAKMLPFTLLGVFLIDIAYFSQSHLISLLNQAYSRLDLLVYYLIFVIVLELALRVLNVIIRGMPGGKAEGKKSKE